MTTILPGGIGSRWTANIKTRKQIARKTYDKNTLPKGGKLQGTINL